MYLRIENLSNIGLIVGQNEQKSVKISERVISDKIMVRCCPNLNYVKDVMLHNNTDSVITKIIHCKQKHYRKVLKKNDRTKKQRFLVGLKL